MRSAKYNIHFVHKVSPLHAPRDSIGPVEIPSSAFASSTALAKVLSKLKVLKGGLESARQEDGGETNLVAVPKAGIWHSLVIQAAGSYAPQGVDRPGLGHLNQIGDTSGYATYQHRTVARDPSFAQATAFDGQHEHSLKCVDRSGKLTYYCPHYGRE